MTSFAKELLHVGSMSFFWSQPLPVRGSISAAVVVNLISSGLVTWTSWCFLPDTRWMMLMPMQCWRGPTRAWKNSRTSLPCPPGRKEGRPRLHCELLRAAPGGQQPRCCCQGWRRQGCLFHLPFLGASPSYPQTGTQKQGMEMCTSDFFGDGWIMQNRKSHGAATLLQRLPPSLPLEFSEGGDPVGMGFIFVSQHKPRFLSSSSCPINVLIIQN